jgi:hypothetical protein
MKILFIAGLPKSGSTLLDLVLSTHSRCVGLGEILQLIKPNSPYLDRVHDSLTACSCGAALATCVFWSDLVARLRQLRGAPPIEKYKLITSAFGKMFGRDGILIDSSKDIAGLMVARTLPIETQVIYLIRDVRSWAVAHADMNERVRQQTLRARGFNSSPTVFSQATPSLHNVFLFLQWYRRNLRLKRYLENCAINYYQLGYEELCASPECILERLCAFIGIAFEICMLSPQGTSSHNILGNRMRFQPDKRARILYDDRWFRVNDWLPAAAMLPMVMRYNRREVYRHPDVVSIWRE